ncbi:MAG: polysaccharide pyruvyl transferase family protein [Bacteroidaceae bacterium]|nr:polysaccharide pyruvyl transferase family protein [Bacteroidaceae bacterium]
MKIGILTQPLRYNIGGLLQNYALQQVLKRLGHKPVTLDPDPYQHVSIIVLAKRLILRLLGKKITVFVEKDLNGPARTKGKNSDKFIRRYIKCFRYSHKNQLKSLAFVAYIVGSDQTWRPKYNRGRLDNMFLDFTQGMKVKRIAYAASFGTDEWEYTEEETSKYRPFLQQFDSVSVREKSAVQICKEKFNVEAIHVLDPTLLLSKEDYIRIIKKDKTPKSPGDLLVYFLDNTDDKKLLEEKVVNDYSLTPFYVNNDFETQEITPQIPVSQWLRGFYDAKYIITDSFHACVFAIIFNKPFILYANMDRGFARYQSLFETFDLKDCLVVNAGEYKGMHSFDFIKINLRLSMLQKLSLDFLGTAL